MNLIFGAGLRQLLQAVDLSQTAGGGLLYDLLTVGDGVELGVQGVALYGKLAVPGDELLPGQGSDPLEEGLKAAGGEGRCV